MNSGGSSGGSTQTSSEPWDGLKPYLTGMDTVDGRWDTPALNYNALNWADQAARGTTTGMAPPLFMDDQRMTGRNVQIPTMGGPAAKPQGSGGIFGTIASMLGGQGQQPQGQPFMPTEYDPYGAPQTGYQPQQGADPYAAMAQNISQPQMAQDYDPTGMAQFSQGPMGYGFGGNGINLRDYMEAQGIAVPGGRDPFNPTITKAPVPVVAPWRPSRDNQEGRGDGPGGDGGGSGGGGSGGDGSGCFSYDTQFEMSDGTFKAIKDIKVGDETKGGRVYNTRTGPSDRDWYDYRGSKVTDDHFVLEAGEWKYIKDAKEATLISPMADYYTMDTTEHRLYGKNDAVFSDDACFDPDHEIHKLPYEKATWDLMKDLMNRHVKTTEGETV